MKNKVEYQTITNIKGFPIPRYLKDFKKLVEKDRELVGYLCRNYEELESEDLGAFLETVEQDSAGFWILSKVKTCFINQSQVEIMQKENKKNHLLKF